MKSLFIHLLALCIYATSLSNTFSQSDNSGRVINQYKEKSNRIMIDPIRTFDWINTGLLVSYERFLIPEFSIIIEGGIMYNLWQNNSLTNSLSSNTGYSGALELRLYNFNSGESKVRYFYGIRLNKTEFETSGTYTFYNLDGIEKIPYQDTVTIYKNNFKPLIIGGMGYFGKHFSYEIAVGTGYGYRHVSHQERFTPTDAVDIKRYRFTYANTPVNKWTFLLHFQFKIGVFF